MPLADRLQDRPTRSATRIARARRWTLFSSALLLAAFVGFQAWGQGQGAQGQDAALEALRDDFRVIETRHGWALQPRESSEDYGLIEIAEGRVTVDGHEVDEEELRRYVDEAADLIFEVAAASDAPEQRVELEEERSTESAEPRHGPRGKQVSFASALTVERDETLDEVVLLGGALEVLGGVDGDATVIMGSATVEGHIDGNLTVIGGPITLRSGSSIAGDLVAVGGEVRRESGSTIEGELVQLGMGDFDFGDVDIDFGRPKFNFFGGTWFDLFSKLFVAGFVLILLLLAFFLTPRRVQAAAHRVHLEPWKAGLVGLVVEVIFGPLLLLVTVVLAVSIVGIPLLAVIPPLLILLLALFLLLGFAGVSLWAGQHLVERFDWRGVGPYVILTSGLALIYGWSILGELLSYAPWPIRAMAVLLLFLGFVVKYAGWTIGLGAAVLNQFAPLDPALGDPPSWRPPEPPAPRFDEAIPSTFADPSETSDGEEPRSP